MDAKRQPSIGSDNRRLLSLLPSSAIVFSNSATLWLRLRIWSRLAESCFKNGCCGYPPVSDKQENNRDGFVAAVGLTSQKARVVKESSDSGVELKQAAESVATANGRALGICRYVRRREEEKVALTLVVAFKMMMFDVFVQRPA